MSDPPAALLAAALLAPVRKIQWRVRAELVSRARSLKGNPPEIVVAFLRRGLKECAELTGGRIALGASALARALELARFWNDAGVFLSGPSSHGGVCVQAPGIAPVWFCHGDANLLERPSGTVLTSRKPKALSPDQPWLAAVKSLYQHVYDERRVIVSSYGTHAYNVLSTIAAMRDAPLIVVCDDVLPWMRSPGHRAACSQWLKDLFPASRLLFLSPFPPGHSPERRERMRERDLTVAEASGAVCAAFVRPGGVMDACLRRAQDRGVPTLIYDPHAAEAQPATTPGSRSPRPTAPCLVSARQKRAHAGPGRSYVERTPPDIPLLVHYTRAHNGPWPGQTIGEYYRSLIEGEADSGHTAFDTLRRILIERVIRGGAGFLRGGAAAVCLTELLPDEASELMVWRRGLARRAMEPYGVAAPKRRLIALGAKPVLYGVPEEYDALSAQDRPFFQLKRRGGVDRSGEKEWRIQGNLSLDQIPHDELLIVVPVREQAEVLSGDFNRRCLLVSSV